MASPCPPPPHPQYIFAVGHDHNPCCGPHVCWAFLLGIHMLKIRHGILHFYSRNSEAFHSWGWSHKEAMQAKTFLLSGSDVLWTETVHLGGFRKLWRDVHSYSGSKKNCQAVPYRFTRPYLPSLKRGDSLPVKLLTNPAQSFQSSNSVSSHSFCGGLLGTCLTLNHPCFCKLSLTHAPVINSRQLAGAHVELWWYCFFGLLLVPYLRWADIHISPKNPVT